MSDKKYIYLSDYVTTCVCMVYLGVNKAVSVISKSMFVYM